MKKSSNMKTLFAVGLFPDKNKTLVKHLCRNFKVIMFRNSHFLLSKGYHVEFLEDIVDEKDLKLSSKEFAREMHYCTQFLKNRISSILCSKETFKIIP